MFYEKIYKTLEDLNCESSLTCYMYLFQNIKQGIWKCDLKRRDQKQDNISNNNKKCECSSITLFIPFSVVEIKGTIHKSIQTGVESTLWKENCDWLLI